MMFKNPLFFDFETTKIPKHLPWYTGAFAVSLHAKMHDTKYTWILNHNEVKFVNHIPHIQQVFGEADLLIAHNLKFDLHWLHALGINFIDKYLYCTMVAEYILSGQSLKESLSLNATATRYGLPTKDDRVKWFWDNGYDTNEIPLSVLLEYGNQDVVVLEEVYKAQQPIIEKQNQKKLINLRCESLKVTQRIEWNGMRMDIPYTQKMSESYTSTIETLSVDLLRVIREQLDLPDYVNINLNSGDDLSAILFGGIIQYDGKENYFKEVWGTEYEEYIFTKRDGTQVPKKRKKRIRVQKEYTRNAVLPYETKGLGFTPAPKTETKKEGYYQTNQAQLSGLKATSDIQKELIFAIKEINKLNHMNNTYYTGLLNKVIGEYVHPTLNETRTSTGRYSSMNPNSQNIPREGTSPVKVCFITRFKEEIDVSDNVDNNSSITEPILDTSETT